MVRTRCAQRSTFETSPVAGINDVPGAKGAMENVGETVGTGVNAVDDAGQARCTMRVARVFVAWVLTVKHVQTMKIE